MGKGIDRTEILRMDCPQCKGQGYTISGSGEVPCDNCGGSGLLEKEVPFKFDGERTLEEKASAFGVSSSEYKDGGHDNQDIRRGQTQASPEEAEDY